MNDLERELRGVFGRRELDRIHVWGEGRGQGVTLMLTRPHGWRGWALLLWRVARVAEWADSVIVTGWREE